MRSLPLLALLVFIASMGSAHAHSVTTNLRFHITDINDVIRFNGASYSGQSTAISANSLAKPFILSERNGTILALVAAGSLVQATINTQSDPYLLSLEQDSAQHRTIIALTNGSWQTMENRSSLDKIPYAAYGNVTAPNVDGSFALRLQLHGIDLRGVVVAGRILVKSLGAARLPVVDIILV